MTADSVRKHQFFTWAHKVSKSEKKVTHVGLQSVPFFFFFCVTLNESNAINYYSPEFWEEHFRVQRADAATGRTVHPRQHSRETFCSLVSHLLSRHQGLLQTPLWVHF